MSRFFTREIRRTAKLAGFAAVLTRAMLRYQRRSGKDIDSLPYRAQWLHETCCGVLEAIGVTLALENLPASPGLFVSNHLSYLDIVAYSAAMPCVFVSKEEVRRWPIFGRFAGRAGTIFVSRRTRTDTASVNERIAGCLSAGVSVMLFPEGTTSPGDGVLRFHSALLQPALNGTIGSVTPCAIAYDLPQGDAQKEVCWWGDMTLAPHVLRLLGNSGIQACIEFGNPVSAAMSRKDLAAALQQRVQLLREGLLSRTTGVAVS